MADNDNPIFGDLIQGALACRRGGIFCVCQTGGHTHDQHCGGQFT